MNFRHLALVGIAALALSGTAAAQQAGQQAPSTAVTPPPPPPPNGAVATPGQLLGTPFPAATASPTPAPARRRGRRSEASPEPSPSDTPEPPQFSTMDGVWEVALQPLNGARTVYSHLYVTQQGEQLSGTWAHGNNDKTPFTGTFDGRLFKLTLKDAKTSWTMAGYAENFSDMVGLLTSSDPKDSGTPFTADHRKKEKIEGGPRRGKNAPKPSPSPGH
ncbi:MAG TPA: hypothetical protein VFB22_12125 [Candidatus Baltobacteraceae bacterium]|nr:hypothetical protein [Candidatus Baltobacteraceae bacterium]